MSKWIAIRTSGVIAIAIGAAALFLAGVMILALLLAPMRDASPLPPAVLRAVGILVALMLGACAAWAVGTGAGIFRRRPWARISILIAGGVFAFFGCLGGIALWFAPFPVDARVDQHAAAIVRYVLIGFYALQAALGAWWLILFNRPAAGRYFVAVAGPAPSVPAKPLSVTLIAWYLLAGAVLTALGAVVRVPGMFFGVLVTGWTAMAVYSLFAIVQLYLGSGLLQLDEFARLGSVVFFVLSAANGCVSFLAPGHDDRLRAVEAQLPSAFRMEFPEWRGVWVSAIVGSLFVAVPIWFLIRRRAAFAAGRGERV